MSDELKNKYNEILGKDSVIECFGINHVNHKPHPFMLGSEHVAFVSDHYSGMLGEPCIQDTRFPPCAVSGCHLKYHEHTSDHVFFVRCIKNCSLADVQSALG